MNRISSFNVDHTRLSPGIYVSRIDRNIVSLDIRIYKPNSDQYLTTTQAHTIEHLMASYLRNSAFSNAVIYFGPGGCLTMFYFLYDSNIIHESAALNLLKNCIKKSLDHEGAVPGQSEYECGHCQDLDLASAKEVLSQFYSYITTWSIENMNYRYFNE